MCVEGELEMKMYDFGLSASQIERANRVYDESHVIDMLCQGPVGTYDIPDIVNDLLEKITAEKFPNDEIARTGMAEELIADWMINGELAETYNIILKDSGLTACCRQLSITDMETLYKSTCKVQKEFDNKPNLMKILKSSDLDLAREEGKIAGIVTSQETLGFGKNVDLLTSAHDFGLRVLQLTYNNHNFVGAGCMEPNDAGLSVFGIKFVKIMNDLGIVVDTGHCGKQTTLDACKHSSKPVIASHTSVESVHYHKRAKSDEELKAIAASGGVVGIFAMPWFTAEDPANTTIDDVLDHIDYAVKLIGEDHVGIGTDWPMPQTTWMALTFKKFLATKLGFSDGDGPSIETVKGLDSYGDFKNFAYGLVSRGYSDEAISKILGGNWVRVFKEVF